MSLWVAACASLFFFHDLMFKDFDRWNRLKKNLERDGRVFYAHAREVWWCSLGVNVGAEIDGKNENFERPIIVMKVYNKETLVVLPLTSKERNDVFHHKILSKTSTVWVKLSQTRVISTKRLLRKVDLLSAEEFRALQAAWKVSL